MTFGDSFEVKISIAEAQSILDKLGLTPIFKSHKKQNGIVLASSTDGNGIQHIIWLKLNDSNITDESAIIFSHNTTISSWSKYFGDTFSSYSIKSAAKETEKCRALLASEITERRKGNSNFNRSSLNQQLERMIPDIIPGDKVPSRPEISQMAKAYWENVANSVIARY